MSLYLDHLRQGRTTGKISTPELEYLIQYEAGNISEDQLRRMEFLWKRRESLSRQMWIVGVVTVVFILGFGFLMYSLS